MQMTWYRIIDSRHSTGILDGRSGALTGGRWNPRGQAAIYCSQTISLAILELCCHYCHPFLDGRFVVAAIVVPAGAIHRIEADGLPERWKSLETVTRDLGRSRFANGALALEVPSVVHAFERNLVLNPEHPDFARVRIQRVDKLEVSPQIHLEDPGDTEPSATLSRFGLPPAG